MGDMSLDLVREIGGVKAEVSGLRADVSALSSRIDEVVISQLKDHGKRLAVLEASENRRTGAIAAIATICGATGAFIGKMLN